MRKVLVITAQSSVPWVGTHHRVRHTIEALLALGYSVDVLCLSAEPDAYPSGAHVLTPRVMRFLGNPPEGPSFRRMLAGCKLFLEALALTRRCHYDVFHGFDDTGMILFLLSKIRKVPFIVDRHSDFEIRGKSWRFWAWLHRRFLRHALRRAAAVTGNSPNVLVVMEKLHRRARTCLLPDLPGLPERVPEGALVEVRTRYGLTDETPLVVCVGEFDRFEGMDIFFNAMPRVLAVAPQTRFVAVGGSGAETMRIVRALKRAKLSGHVEFPGRLPPADLAALLAVATVLVSPRRKGVTAPVKVLDYLQAARPIVAADTPANRVLLNADNALVVRSTAQAMAEGIIRLLRRRQEAEALAHQGRATLRREGRTFADFCESIRLCYTYIFDASPAARP